jgi:hypothetical protein
MFEAQLAKVIKGMVIEVIPFINLGIGPSINYANSYQNEHVGKTGALGGFKNAWNVDCSYQLGLGLAIPFNTRQNRVAIGYRYVNLGTAKFNATDYDEEPKYKLDIGKIKSHEVYISYTHLFSI